jgi:hypothetical protein
VTNDELRLSRELDRLVPLPDRSDASWADALARADRSGPRRWTLRAGVAAAAALVVVTAGLAVAARGWLVGRPAPPPVVQDFRDYTPQLGFHPDAGQAVLVAQDGAIKLYATTNREGTYCLVVDEPWKPPSAGDGGTCVPKMWARYPITAGVIGASGDQGTGQIEVVAGRVDDRDARRVRFSDPVGKSVERSLGTSGFFVVAIHASAGCPDRDWVPVFTALAAHDKVIGQEQIPLIQNQGSGIRRVCGGGVAPHGPYRPGH